jgi:hypothetical protein
MFDKCAPYDAQIGLRGAYNFRRILAWLRRLLRLILRAWLAAFLGSPLLNPAS